MAFSYQYASIEQITKHFMTASRSTVSEALRYYQARKDILTVEKIEAAKVSVRAAKKQSKLRVNKDGILDENP